MHKHEKEKMKIQLPLHVGLGYLLVCTLMLTGVTFSSYVTSTSGGDSARVAKFEVTANDKGSDISLSEDVPSGNYTFTVTSASEVSVTYDVVVTLPSALPTGVTMTLDTDMAATVNNNTYTFSDAGSFDPAGGTNSHILTVSATSFDADETLSGITVKVVATQMD